MSISKPNAMVTPFAVSGFKNTIPVPSQIGISDGKASYVTGFPPLTMKTIASGGIPPDGFDQNGILYEVSAHTTWQNSGGIYKFDTTISGYNTGYPAGAILWNDAGDQTYVSLTDNNAINFNTTPTSIGVSWAPVSAKVLDGVNAYNSTTTLTVAADTNKLISLGNGTFDVTVPQAGICKAGTTIQMVTKNGNQNIRANAADAFMIGANAVANFPLNLSGFCTLISDGISRWIVSGTPALPPSLGVVPIGGIIIFSGSIANIDPAWSLCDGTNGTPNLSDRFVIGAGGSLAVGATGGGATTSANGAGVTGGHILTIAELPAHGHPFAASYTQQDSAHCMPTGGFITSTIAQQVLGANNGAAGFGQNQQIGAAGGNAAHSHTTGNHQHTVTPPFMALCYIMRRV